MTVELSQDFLVSLGQALSAGRLYDPDHPARERAVEEAWGRAERLLKTSSPVVFTFLEGEVALGDRRIPALRDWPWGQELAGVGVERIELAAGLDRDELADLVAALSRQLAGDETVLETWRDAGRNARFGPLKPEEEAEFRADLEERLDDVDRLFEQARSEGEISPRVAEAVVGSVTRAIRQTQNLLKLLVPLKEVDQYSTVHSMNVSLLSIGFAEHQGYRGPDVKTVGESALLHDVGKSLIPEEILQKEGPLTAQEWEVMRQHPEDGARILLRSRNGLLLPAVVAYEHHWYMDGDGYPSRRYERDPHPVSQLVQICDIFDALRTRRPFRGPWPADKIVRHLEDGAGTRFRWRTVRAFIDMLGEWEEELAELSLGDDVSRKKARDRRPGATPQGDDGPGDGGGREESPT